MSTGYSPIQFSTFSSSYLWFLVANGSKLALGKIWCFFFFFCFIEDTPCPAIDLGIILDSSGSLDSGDNQENIQKFAKALIGKFDVKPGEDGTHVSIVQFDSDPTLLLRFNDLQTKSNVESKIDSYRIRRGSTYINKALDMTHDEFASGMRGPRYPKVRIPSCLQICI